MLSPLILNPPIAQGGPLAASNVTATGTVSAEQLTSTDDANVADRLLLTRTPGAQQATPTIALGDGDTGFYEVSDDFLLMSAAGIALQQWTGLVSKMLWGLSLGGNLQLENVVASAITGNIDNHAPTGISTANCLRFTSDGAYNWTGLGGSVTSKVLLVMNASAFTITLKHDVTSTAANRFYLPGSTDYLLLANASVWLFYDATSSRWRLIG